MLWLDGLMARNSCVCMRVFGGITQTNEIEFGALHQQEKMEIFPRTVH